MCNITFRHKVAVKSSHLNNLSLSSCASLRFKSWASRWVYYIIVPASIVEITTGKLPVHALTSVISPELWENSPQAGGAVVAISPPPPTPLLVVTEACYKRRCPPLPARSIDLFSLSPYIPPGRGCWRSLMRECPRKTWKWPAVLAATASQRYVNATLYRPGPWTHRI